MISLILIFSLGVLFGALIGNYSLNNYNLTGYIVQKFKKIDNTNCIFISNDTDDWIVRFKRNILNQKCTYMKWKVNTSFIIKKDFWNEIREWSKRLGLKGNLQTRNRITGEIKIEK